jgi:hypothetical protein
MVPNRALFPIGIACFAALCGLLMSTLPYFAWYKVAHSSIWIADSDELIYAEVASNAYYQHPVRLSDPTFVNGGQSVYSWLQLVPAELVCKAFALRPIRFGLVLRIFGGLAVGFGWYAIVWQHVRRPWVALVGAVFLLTDSGWLITRPFIYQWTTLWNVVIARSGAVFAHNPSIHREWRIISPIVILPFLFFCLWALRRSVENSSHERLVCSGFAFGLLFYAYFYYWTAAVLALLLGFLLDRTLWRTYFHTGWIGFLIGAPELAGMLFSRRGLPDWMQRNDEFVPISRLSEHGHFFLSAALVVITFAIVWRFSRRMLYLWCFCAAGFVMIHQQVFTGLQMQNYHWAYLFCPCMILLLVLLTMDAIVRAGARAGVVGKILVVVVVFNAVAGVYLRGLEAVRTMDSQRYSREYRDYDRQHGVPEYQPLVGGATTAGDEDFVEFAIIVDRVTPLAAAYPIIWSPAVSDLDFNRRIALNAYLSGMSREQFEAKETGDLDHLQYGVELRDPIRRAARLASRLAFYDQIVSDPASTIEHYQVKYVALLAGSLRPAMLGSDWAVLQTGPTWEVWQRRAFEADSRF